VEKQYFYSYEAFWAFLLVWKVFAVQAATLALDDPHFQQNPSLFLPLLWELQ
jgi:hypothetical protein